MFSILSGRRRFVRIVPVLAVLTGLLSAPASAGSALGYATVVTALTAAGQSNDSNNRNVRIHNQTGWTMVHLYASGGAGWTDDLLASRPLTSGNSQVVRIDDGSGACRYALRAEFDNGQTLQRSGLGACEVADYYFTR